MNVSVKRELHIPKEIFNFVQILRLESYNFKQIAFQNLCLRQSRLPSHMRLLVDVAFGNRIWFPRTGFWPPVDSRQIGLG